MLEVNEPASEMIEGVNKSQIEQFTKEHDQKYIQQNPLVGVIMYLEYENSWKERSENLLKVLTFTCGVTMYMDYWKSLKAKIEHHQNEH